MEAKLFYANEVINENMGIRDLRKIIAQKTYERTKIANTQISKITRIINNIKLISVRLTYSETEQAQFFLAIRSVIYKPGETPPMRKS